MAFESPAPFQNGFVHPGAGPVSPTKPPIPDHELIRRIGTGAYGEVWLARNVLGAARAVKVIHRKSFREERSYEREFRGIQQFEPISRSNEALLDILQAGRNDEAGYYYYVMELADNSCGNSATGSAGRGLLSSPDDWHAYLPKTLTTIVQERGRLPPWECVQLGLNLTLALGHLHRHGLIHRDIKPANIIFVGGIPKLADIGLVTTFDDTCSFVGTEGYIAPEGPTSPRADLFSLGKVLYEVSTGKDRKDFPEPPTGLGEQGNGQELAELNAVVLKACASDPRERYQSAEELHADLALLNSGKSVRGKRVIEKRLAFARRAGAVVALIAALATGGYLYQRFQTREAKRLQGLAEDLVAKMQIQKAENLLDRGDSSLALAHLALVLRQHPNNRVAAERLIAALSQRNFPRLLIGPLVHVTKFNLRAHRSSARLSPDGQLILTVCEDATVHFWNARTGEQTRPPYQHQGAVHSAEFSPDGLKVVTASNDGSACVLDARTGALLFPPLSHNGPVRSAIFSPDGKWIATASEDSQARLFDAATGQPLMAPLTHDGPVHDVAFSPDGRRLATALEGGRVSIWEIPSGQEKHRFPLDGPARIVRFSRDGNWLAATIQNSESGLWRVQVWDPESGRPVTGPLLHQKRIYSLEFSPDSQRLVTATANHIARVWRVETGEEQFQLRHASLVYFATYSPDGRQILTASVDHSARLWDATTGASISEAMVHQGRVIHAEFSRDGSQVLTAGWEDKQAKLWTARPGRGTSKTLPHEVWVKSAEFDDRGVEVMTTTGRVIATAGNDNAWNYGGQHFAGVWDAAAGLRRTSPSLPKGAEAVAARFTPVGPKFLLSNRKNDEEYSKVAWIWDPRAATMIGQKFHHQDEITCADFSADGRQVAIGSEDGVVLVWDTSLGVALTPPLVHRGRLRSVRFSPDGTLLVTASEKGTASIWHVPTGQRFGEPLQHGDVVWFAQFNHQNDKVVTASSDYTAKIWSTNATLLAALQHGAPVEYAEFSPDGLQLTTASGDKARLWSVDSGKEMTEPLQHAELVMTSRFSGDGLRLITASKDRTVQLWDTQTGLKLADPFRHDDWVISARFSPDGRRAITASLDRTARIWEVAEVQGTIPDWLTDLADVVAGQRLNSDRMVELVSWSQGVDLKARLETLPSTDRLGPWAQAYLGLPLATLSPNH